MMECSTVHPAKTPSLLNKNRMFRSFKGKDNIHKKEDGPDCNERMAMNAKENILQFIKFKLCRLSEDQHKSKNGSK